MLASEPNWLLWNSAERARLFDCALLMLRLDPASFDPNTDRFKDADLEKQYQGYLTILLRTATANDNRHPLFLLSMVPGKYGEISLRRFVDWARANNWPVPLELTGAPIASTGVEPKLTTAIILGEGQKAASLTYKNENLLKLVYAMARGGYGYDPASRKSPVPKDIAKDATHYSVETTAETIRNYLDEARQLVELKK